MSVHYMNKETFVAYRLLSIGAKLLPVQSMEETQAFTKQVMRQMRQQGQPVDKGREIANAALNAVRGESDKPEARAYLAQQRVRRQAWAAYRSDNPVREVHQR